MENIIKLKDLSQFSDQPWYDLMKNSFSKIKKYKKMINEQKVIAILGFANRKGVPVDEICNIAIKLNVHKKMKLTEDQLRTKIEVESLCQRVDEYCRALNSGKKDVKWQK